MKINPLHAYELVDTVRQEATDFSHGNLEMPTPTAATEEFLAALSAATAALARRSEALAEGALLLAQRSAKHIDALCETDTTLSQELSCLH